ncbi:MAG TPA: MtrB/PioB family outer membrane beta-barrel protein, partial [Burkholderiales bacterium]|nr:MtrB/PioB family outer membrane beta-barrel protein [Burkholderiales bacterium]
NNGENEPRNIKTKDGKLDATYQLPAGFRLGGGVEVVEKTRNSPPVRSVGFRETTDENIYNVNLRRAIGEAATGSVALVHSKRYGSDFLTNTFFGGAVYSNAIAPLHLADRDRDTVRFVLNWTPTEPLAINLRTDVSQDNYSGRTTTGFELGPRKGTGQFFSLDGAYTFSDRLQASAWASHTANTYQNATCVETGTPLGCTNLSASPVWSDKLANIDNSFGVGLRGQPTAQIKAGVDYVQSKVRDSMMLIAETATGTASGITSFLPEINTRVTTLKLYAEYALRRDSGVRVQYVHDRYATDDWTWQNWRYSDGTTVTQDPNQTVNFIGVSVYFRF